MAGFEGDRHHPVTFSFTTEREGRSSDGAPDAEMLRLITKYVGDGGIALDVAVGDGRYLTEYSGSKTGLQIVAGDFNPKALQTLKLRVPEDQSNRVAPIVFDAFEPFPLPDGAVSSVICTAMLHIRPPADIKRFAEQSHRVLGENGILAIDLSTNIRRLDPWGNERTGPTEADYNFANGVMTVKSALKGLFDIQHMGVSNVRPFLRVQDKLPGGRTRNTSIDVTLKKVNVIARKAA